MFVEVKKDTRDVEVVTTKTENVVVITLDADTARHLSYPMYKTSTSVGEYMTSERNAAKALYEALHAANAA
jgi:RNA:NAD 2'-phosphotransferase (TPT1/KptA family)